MKAKEQSRSPQPGHNRFRSSGEAAAVDFSTMLERPDRRRGSVEDDRSVTAEWQKVKQLI